MESAKVESLHRCALVLHAALPTNMQSLLDDQDVSRLLAVFQVNATLCHNPDTEQLLLPSDADTAVASSTYASSLACRCLFATISMIEHSCAPNAQLVWHRNNQLGNEGGVLVGEVRAIRAIAAGERISISYLPLVLSRDERQGLLWRRYYFHCQCRRCVELPDIMRSVDLIQEGRTMAPVGSGKEWAAEDGQLVAMGHDWARRAAMEEANTLKRAADGGSILQVFLDQRGEDGVRLTPWHYGVFASFMHATKSATLEDVPSLIAYTTKLTDRTLQPSSGTIVLSCLLQHSDPIHWLFSMQEESIASVRDRLIGQDPSGRSGSVEVARLAKSFLAPRVAPDDATTTLSLCYVAWEALFAVCQRLCGIDTPSLRPLRSGLALGLWMMHSFGSHNLSRSLQWQAVLLAEFALP